MAPGDLLTLLEEDFAQGQTLQPPLKALGALVLTECGVVGAAALGNYSNGSAMVNSTRWRWGQILWGLPSLVLQMLMTNASLQMSWSDAVSKWTPVFENTTFANSTLREVATHRACLPAGPHNNLAVDGSERFDAEQQQNLQEALAEEGYAGWRRLAVEYCLAEGPITENHCLSPNGFVFPSPTSLGPHILAHVVDVVTGQDFDVVLKERLFAPLGMTTAEVQQGNLDEGLIASLEDLGYLVRFLLQGYHGRGEAMWQTALKQPDFRELLSIPEGASGGWAIFADLTATSSGLSLSTSGCNADRVAIEWEANRGYVLATYPEDLEADWPSWYGPCRASWQGLVLRELPSLQSTFGCGSFQTCSRGGSACEILESFVLDNSTLDAYYASDCTEGQLSESANTTLQEYLAKEPDNTQKTMLLSSDCAKGFVAYRDDYCLSIHDADAYCWGEGPCQIFLIGNHTYDPGLYPCRCRRRVTPGVCGIVGEPLCNYSLAPVEEEVACALRRTTVAATTTTTNTSGEQGVSSTTTTWDTGSVSSGWRPHIPALLMLSWLF